MAFTKNQSQSERYKNVNVNNTTQLYKKQNNIHASQNCNTLTHTKSQINFYLTHLQLEDFPLFLHLICYLEIENEQYELLPPGQC